MSTVVSDHLRDAQRGGIPSIFNLVSSFVGLKFDNPNATIGKNLHVCSYLLFLKSNIVR